MRLFAPSKEGLSETAQALYLDAQRAGAVATIIIQYPESEENEDHTLIIGSFDANTLVSGAVKSVEAEPSNAKEWLEALPQIQSMLLKLLEETETLVHFKTGDIAIPNLVVGNEDRGEAMLAWINTQGTFISYSDGFFLDGKLYAPDDYANMSDEEPQIVDGKPDPKYVWVEISTGEPLLMES